jgi:predicted transcriptional regulator
MVMKLVPAIQEDRVLAAIRHAPIVEVTPEEMAAFEEGMADIRAGRTTSAEQVRAQLEARAKE